MTRIDRAAREAAWRLGDTTHFCLGCLETLAEEERGAFAWCLEVVKAPPGTMDSSVLCNNLGGVCKRCKAVVRRRAGSIVCWECRRWKRAHAQLRNQRGVPHRALRPQ